MAIPDACDPKKTSWWSYLFSCMLFSNNSTPSWKEFAINLYYLLYSARNECLEFEKSIRINPLAKVIPSVVFSHTLSMMFIHPLKDLGAKVGDFLVGVSSK